MPNGKDTFNTSPIDSAARFTHLKVALYGRVRLEYRISEALITVRPFSDRLDSAVCGTLPVVAAGAAMPMVTTCQEGAVGRFLVITRGTEVTDLMDIGEMDVMVEDVGEFLRDDYCMQAD